MVETGERESAKLSSRRKGIETICHREIRITKGCKQIGNESRNSEV